jgi:hypothetical protein
MGTIHHHHASGQREAVAPENRSHFGAEPPLTYRERCRVALGALALLERRCQMRLAQIRAERAALVTALQSARALQ